LFGGEWLSVGSTAALLISVALCAVARKALPTRAAGMAISTTFALVPVAVLGAMMAFEQPLATTSVPSATCDGGILFVATLFIFVGCTSAMPFVMLLTMRRAERGIVLGGTAAVICSAIVAAMALASLRKPEPDAYLDLFSERAEVEPGGHAIVDGVVLSYSTVSDGSCALILQHADSYETKLIDAACPPLHVYGDAVSSTIIVTRHAAAHWRGGKPQQLVLVDRRGSLDFSGDIMVDDLRARLGVPHAWVFGATTGTLLAACAMFAAWRARRRRTTFRLLADGHHVGGGWVSVDNTAPRFVPELAAAAALPGPVVVHHDMSNPIPTYRDDGAPLPLSVMLGTRASLEAADSARSAAWACVAIAIAVMTSAPLWAARLHGLL
jgi:hypothetical protein